MSSHPASQVFRLIAPAANHDGFVWYRFRQCPLPLQFSGANFVFVFAAILFYDRVRVGSNPQESNETAWKAILQAARLRHNGVCLLL